VVSDERKQCKATTKAGHRCKRLAKAGSDFCGLPGHGDDRPSTAGAPPGNRNAVKHGFYSQIYTEEDLADIASVAAAADLSDEIALLRVFIRRVAVEGVETMQAPELLSAISRACGRLTQMLKAQRQISGEAADGFQQALAEVLDGLAEELDLGLG
jgi:hypothetical protein